MFSGTSCLDSCLSISYFRYYISTLEGKPGERHLFRVDTDVESPDSFCITCDLSSDCLFNNAYFSSDATYYALECLGPGVPRVTIKSLRIDSSDQGEHCDWMSNRM